MNLIDAVKQYFNQSVQTAMDAEPQLDSAIARGAELIVHRLLQGGKVLVCGNGGSASIGQIFATAMMNRLERERSGLPVVRLTDSATITSIAADYDFDEVFAKQIRALGHPGDLLLVISADGNSANNHAAVEAAQEREMLVIALTGKSEGQLADLLRPQDIEIRVPAEQTSHILEIHLLIVHCLCHLVDLQLFGIE